MSDLTVACVLRTGGPYTPSYVHRLRDAVDEHLDRDYTFCCLTDLPDPFARTRTERLRHEWPGWWSKIELFRPDLFRGRVLYLDLDTSLVGSIDEIAGYEGRFAMIDDQIWTDTGGSGVMCWEAGDYATTRIYEPFSRDAEGLMDSHRGDQRWIAGAVDWEPLRQLFPGQLVSRWEECVEAVPDDARIVYWHGTPKPHEIEWELVGDRYYWREQVA